MLSDRRSPPFEADESLGEETGAGSNSLARRIDPITLEELSTEFGVSRERIRQIEVRAFEKVQKAVQNAARLETGDAA